MDSQYWLPIILFLTVIAIFLFIALWKHIQNNSLMEDLSAKVQAAEEKAFTNLSSLIPKRTEASGEDHDLLLGATPVDKVESVPGSTVSQHQLFLLYSQQIKKYQEETRNRATSSFSFAIIAMFAGIIFIFWGGIYILSEKTTDATIAGSVISTIGGAVSAYITKTFLEVHKLSLQQLNKYFRQPVINDHIVMAQRLADGLDDPQSKQSAYQSIIQSINKLIDAEHDTES